MDNNNNNAPLSGYQQLKNLRTSLAICQGIKLLSTLQQEAEGTVSHDQTKRVTYLTSLFSRIHREIFQDWKEQASVSHRPGSMTDPNRRREFRETIERLVLDGDTNKETAIFDNNGFVIRTDDIAERLAGFYQRMRNVRPFSYGNRITLDFFITMLGKLPAIKSVYEEGIDFRRIDVCDVIALHDPTSSRDEITLAFRHAMDPTRSRSLPNQANGYGKWPENKRYISGIPFLSHRTPDGIECLVSVNGALVPIASVRRELFIAGKHLADYPLCAPENIIGYLPGTEDLRPPVKFEIDGVKINEDGSAPLFCLDINMLTGLRSPGHTELLELLKQCAGEKAVIFDLVTQAELKSKMLNSAGGDSRLQRAVEIAHERLSKIVTKLDQIRDNLFQGKSGDPQPKLFMSMGGAGSGKTAVEEIAQAKCGDNFVVASLDEFRKQSDLYRVLTAAGHHSDDYVYVEPFANRLRDSVAQHARLRGINLLYDGTGIPYQPRYSTIVEQFKNAGFHTQIVAVDAFLVKPHGRENELQRSGVIGSVKQRFETTSRALPWVVTIDKHIRAPRSFLNALNHNELDKISLFANDGEIDRHYLVAESFVFSSQEIRVLQEHQLQGTLHLLMNRIIREHSQSLLKNLVDTDLQAIDKHLARNPAFNEENCAYQIYPGTQSNRVLLIYNTKRFADFIEKRQLNPHASGEEGLLHKSEALAFHVDPFTNEPWMVRLQGSSLF